MVDYDKQIVAKLKEIGLNVYYDYNLDSSKEAPCISYYNYDNSANIEGDLIGYSNIIYKVKVWNKDPDNLSFYSSLVDSKMRELGFKRTNYFEQWVNGLGCKELKYQNLALEKF